MSDNVIIWSLDKSKFLKIVASLRYTEKLCFVDNIEWHLDLQRTREPLRSRTCYDFYLRSCGVKTDTVVCITKFENARIISELKWNFVSNKTKIKLFTSDCQRMFDKQWDYAFRFHRKVEELVSAPSKHQKIMMDCNTELLAKEEIIHLTGLSADFKSLLKSEQLSDFTINCGTAVFNVHKTVLHARSPVFKAMFQCRMQEQSTNSVLVDDIEPEVMQFLVEYLYCGQVKVSSLSLTDGLLYAAEKYQIKDLKTGLLDYLKSVLTVDNSVKILEMSDLYDDKLKTYVLEFITSHVSALKQSEDWKNLKITKPALALEVYAVIE